MKELINKCTQTITAILISSIVGYGVYAQKVCCKTIIDACIPASDRISSGYTTGSHWTTFQSQSRNIQLQSNFCSKNILADSGAGKASIANGHTGRQHHRNFASGRRFCCRISHHGGMQ
jgi:hypothetical protein